MKIGLLIYGSLETLSGGYLYDRELVNYLRAQGEAVEIISLPWRSYPAHLTDNLRFRLPSGLDILIEDELNHPSLLAANAGRHPYPLVSLVHHLRCSEQHPAWKNWINRAVEKSYLRSVDAFIINSATTSAVVRELAGCEKPELIANPPADRFGSGLPEQEVMARSRQPGPLRLVFLGNLIPRKGLHTLLSALENARAEIRLDVIGSPAADPVYAQKMETLVSSSRLAGRVTFHGSLDMPALAGFLKTAHVLVVPSSYEGFGIVYLEGMAFGLPAIGTTGGAAGEIITDGQTGFLIPPGNASRLARSLESLALDRALLGNMSLMALERYRRQPAWEYTAEQIRQFLLVQVNSWSVSSSKPA